jgi:hypothetical protein
MQGIVMEWTALQAATCRLLLRDEILSIAPGFGVPPPQLQFQTVMSSLAK